MKELRDLKDLTINVQQQLEPFLGAPRFDSYPETLSKGWSLNPAFSFVAWRGRCPANMAHVRQSRPGSGRGFQAKVVRIFQAVSSSFGSRA